MKRVVSLMLILVLSLSVVGCAKSVSQEALEKMEKELESKNYEKALSYIDIALDDEKIKDEDRSKAHEIKAMLEDYLSALDYFEKGELELSKSILDNMDKKYENYIIKDDIKKLLEDIESLEAEREIDIRLDELEEDIEKNELELARSLYKELVDEELTEKQEERLNSLLKLLEDKEEQVKEEAEREEKAAEEKRANEAKKEAEKSQPSSGGTSGGTGKPIYKGKDAWKNHSDKRPDYVNKRIEENKKRGQRYR